jgi:microcystin-dependent protein
MADYTQQGLYQEGNSLFDDIFAFGDLEVQNINVVGIITASKLIGDGSELSGIDATTIKDSTGTTQIQGTTSGATHSGRAVFNEIEIGGKLYDGDGDFGTSGQVLASDGTNTNWINSGSLTAGAAAEVGVTAVNTDATHFITFVDSSSGNENIRVDTDLTYNPSTNTLGGTNISSLYVTGNLRIGGQLKDGDNAFGSSGQVLSSDGTDTRWVNAGSLTAGAASEVGITAVNDNSSHFLAFLDSSSGNDNIKVDTNLTYNPSTNLLSLGGISFSGTISGGTSVSATNISGNLSGTLQTAAQTNITSVGTLTGLTVDGNLILDSTSNYLHIKGALYDKDGQSGSNGQVLVSTGSQVDWQNPNTLTASNSLKITITESDTNTAFPITFSAAPGQSGGNTLLSDNQFTYNASSNTVTAGTFSGSGASLTSLNASSLQSGTVADARLTNTSLFVTGMIMLWYGSVASIPSGWVLCDGNNSTPDLRNRFVIGSGSGSSYPINQTGGSADATLVSHSHTINNHTHSFSGSDSHSHTINNHTHTFSATTGSDSHSHSYSSANHPSSSGPEQDQSGGPENRTQFNVGKTTGSDSHSHSVSGTTGNPSNTGTNSQTVSISGNTGNPSNTGTNSQGSSATNKNLPPYYALCYIMKT